MCIRDSPQAGHIHRFMVGALIAGPVAKEADHHIVLLLHLKGQSDTRRDGQVSANDGVGHHSAHRDVAGVHSAALAAAAALGLAEHLTHHGLDADTLGDIMAGGPMGGGHPVLMAQIVEHTDGAGLLASALVDGAGHDAL